jgi:hypothetical protein
MREDLRQFADLEGEAEKKPEEVYRDLGHRYPRDWSEAAEIAHEAGSDHYTALAEMRDQVLIRPCGHVSPVG